MPTVSTKEDRFQQRYAALYRGLLGGDSTLQVSNQLQRALAKIPHGSITGIKDTNRLDPGQRGK